MSNRNAAELIEVANATAHAWENGLTVLGYMPTPQLIRDLAAALEAAQADNGALRKFLAFAYAGAALYCDDGELQDNRKAPVIDFRRDSVADIRTKLAERAARSVQGSADR